MTKTDAGRGAIFGALAGDATGAVLEFFEGSITPDDVEGAMQMDGGGVLETAPGQITDDGEMALCLMHALAGEETFSIERVAEEYLRWHQSAPFDMGNTTNNGLNGGIGAGSTEIHIGMWEAAERFNTGSKANGGLMRITPLGVWGHRLSEEELVGAVCMDNRLTHPNPVCQHTSAVYCIAIRHLMHNPGDADGAFRKAREWSEKLQNEEVIEWLECASDNIDVGYEPNIGFVKYGFVHAFRHLNNRTPYPEAVFETLSGGGDTDTNACIVGGLIGALTGVDGIPETMQEALLRCDTGAGCDRPEFLQTRIQLPDLIDKIIA